MPVAKEVVDQVMSSITESDATLLEKLLRALRQNADRGLEHVAKQASHRPARLLTLSSSDLIKSQIVTDKGASTLKLDNDGTV